MEIEVIPQTVNILQISISEEQARAYLADARPLQDELRAALAPLGAARQTRKSIALEPKASAVKANGHSPKASSRTRPAEQKGKGGYKMTLKKCPACGAHRHPKTSTCQYNRARTSGAASSSPSSAGESTAN